MTIESILKRIRESPLGADVYVTLEERVILDPLWGGGYGVGSSEIGYYAGHTVLVRPRETPIGIWRVGRRVSINVYEGDRPVCQCHNEEDARRIAAAMNFARAEGK